MADETDKGAAPAAPTSDPATAPADAKATPEAKADVVATADAPVQKPTVGGAAEAGDDTNEYFLKRGAEHWSIINGEHQCFKGDDGDSVHLNDEQFQLFKDKLLPLGKKPEPLPVAE